MHLPPQHLVAKLGAVGTGTHDGKLLLGGREELADEYGHSSR